MARRRDQRKKERQRRPPAAKPAAPSIRGPSLSRLDALNLVQSVQDEARAVALRELNRTAPADQASVMAAAVRDIALRVIRQSPQQPHHACRAGCSFCCHTAVTSSPAEAIAILQHLHAVLDADVLADVRRRVKANAALAAKQTRKQYIAANIPCALLTDDGLCRVHPVRPLTCAGFLSTSREACEAEFNRAPQRAPVPVDRQAMFGVMGTARGLRDACIQSKLDGESYELHQLLDRLWDVSAPAAAWSAGRTLSAGCLRAETW